MYINSHIHISFVEHLPLIKEEECDAGIVQVQMHWVDEGRLKYAHQQLLADRHPRVKGHVGVHPAVVHQVDLVCVVAEKLLTLTRLRSRVHDHVEIHIRYNRVLSIAARGVPILGDLRGTHIDIVS